LVYACARKTWNQTVIISFAGGVGGAQGGRLATVFFEAADAVTSFKI